MIDHATPRDRLARTRATDHQFRGWHVTVFLLVAILGAYGLAQRAEDLQAEREAQQLAEQAAVVIHKLKMNCGL